MFLRKMLRINLLLLYMWRKIDKRSNYFSYKLLKKDHLKHFRDNNPFGNKCRVKNNEG